MNTNLVRFGILLATIGLGGCGESTTVIAGELDEAQAQQLAGVVMAATFGSTGSIPQQQPALGPDGPQAVAFTFATEIDTSVQCAGGGVVDIAASLEVAGDTQSDAGSVEYSMTQIHDACIVTSDAGTTFTLWGNPSMNVAFTVENDGEGVVEWAGSVQGTIDWETDGFEGSCAVQMEFAGREEADVSAEAELMGSVCGFDIDQSISIG